MNNNDFDFLEFLKSIELHSCWIKANKKYRIEQTRATQVTFLRSFQRQFEFLIRKRTKYLPRTKNITS